MSHEDRALSWTPAGRRTLPQFSRAVLVSFNGNDFRDTYLGAGKDHIIHGTAVLDDHVLEKKVPALFLRKDRTTSQPSFEISALRRTLRGFALFRLLAPFLEMEHLAIDFRVNQRFIAYSFWSQVPYPLSPSRPRTSLSTRWNGWRGSSITKE